MAGNNMFDFRIVHVVKDGSVVSQRMEVRCKNLVSSVLGVIPLEPTYGPWQPIEIVTESA